MELSHVVKGMYKKNDTEWEQRLGGGTGEATEVLETLISF